MIYPLANLGHIRARWTSWLCVALLGWMTALGQSALGQVLPAVGLPATSPQTNSAAGGTATDATAATLETRLTAARGELAVLGDSGATNAPAGIAPQEGWMRRALLHRLVRLYEQQLSNLAALEKARTRKTETAREALAWTRFTTPAPYSILLADRLREELQAERQKIKSNETAASARLQLIEENRGALVQAEEKIRQLNEQLESANDPAVTARLSWQRGQERLRSEVAAASVAVLDSERSVGQEALAESRVRLELLQRQLLIAEVGAKFTQADLDEVISRIDRQHEQLERELAETQLRRLAALKALETARQELRAVPGQSADSAAASRAMELVSARESQSDTADTAAYVVRALLEGASVERTMWELRFAAYDSRSVETLRESESSLDKYARRLDLWRSYAGQRSQEASDQLQLQEARLNDFPLDSALRPLAGERLTALRERDQLLLRFVRGLEHLERLTARWAESVHAAESNLPLSGRVRNLFSGAGSFLQRLWVFEVFTAEDTITVDGQKITGKRSVTIGKIVMAVLILVLGYWITGLLTALVEPIIVKRLKIEPNQANLIRRWLRALLVVCLLLFSLVSVKIPLTVFAFAGGALAIGLGFGMQTIIKNFVSGLILLFERPFRVGDVLDVAGQKGAVTSIGLRASVLHLWDGTETLIPNSSLLENNVTNWTYSNRKVRFIVGVGVAYGSDARRVIELLDAVAQRHGLVEKEPKPQVLFTEFGDSTLNFELRFWADVAKANAAQVSSDLRLMIVGSFAEAGIVIAFPQRDLHLYADRPIPMQVVQVAAQAAILSQASPQA